MRLRKYIKTPSGCSLRKIALTLISQIEIILIAAMMTRQRF
jgi:hypothetical protein